MKKKIILLVGLSSILIGKNVYAFDSNNYKYRNTCDNYELANFYSDGRIETIGCYATYEQAK